MLARTLAALLLVAACTKEPQAPVGPPAGPAPDPSAGTGAPAPAPAPTPMPGPAPAPSTPPTPTTPAPSQPGAKLGEPCGPGDACGEGSCVTYYGIAGARGPAFKSCELRCDPQRHCEGGRRCITVADGPGQVCR